MKGLFWLPKNYLKREISCLKGIQYKIQLVEKVQNTRPKRNLERLGKSKHAQMRAVQGAIVPPLDHLSRGGRDQDGCVRGGARTWPSCIHPR